MTNFPTRAEMINAASLACHSSACDGQSEIVGGAAAEAAVDAILALFDRATHLKRLSEYIVLGHARIQTNSPLNDYDNVVVYQSAADGNIWARPQSEFFDGRFVIKGTEL